MYIFFAIYLTELVKYLYVISWVNVIANHPVSDDVIKRTFSSLSIRVSTLTLVLTQTKIVRQNGIL